MADYEYMTAYIKQQLEPGDGDGPKYVCLLSVGEEPDTGEPQSVSGVAEALASFQQLGWTLIALVLIENDDTNKVYQATFRRAVS